MRATIIGFLGLILAMSVELRAQDDAGEPFYGLGDIMVQDTTTYFTQKQGEEISAQLYEALEKWTSTGDPSAYIKNLDPDVWYVRRGDGIKVQGIEPALAAMGGLMSVATDISFAVDSVKVIGAYIISYGTVTGTLAGTKHEIKVPFSHAIFIDVETGKVVAIGDGTDLAALRSQIEAASVIRRESWAAVKRNMRN